MDKRNLSLHEDLLDLFQKTLSGVGIENIFACQKKITESLGYSGFSCLLWEDKSKAPKFVFDDPKLKIEDDTLTSFGDALIHSTDKDLLAINHESNEFHLLPILKDTTLVGFYTLVPACAQKL